MIRVVHLGSGSGSWLFTHPGSRGQKGTGFRIRISNTTNLDPYPKHTLEGCKVWWRRCRRAWRRQPQGGSRDGTPRRLHPRYLNRPSAFTRQHFSRVQPKPYSFSDSCPSPPLLLLAGTVGYSALSEKYSQTNESMWLLLPATGGDIYQVPIFASYINRMLKSLSILSIFLSLWSNG